ncbi:MAG TPA: hypothetical protein VF572_06750 [Candidatus Saccharimonadales bacterium]|jgi:hypothetical protein
MAKPSPEPKLTKPAYRRYLAYAVAAIIVIASIYIADRQAKLSALTEYPNQGCIGLGSAVRNNIPLTHSDFEARINKGPLINTNSGPKGVIGWHNCNIGRVFTNLKAYPDGSASSRGYELGGSVVFFDTATDADQFGQMSNKNRSWSVDDATAKANYPQSGLHTYLVTDVKEPYFEAYTVRGTTSLNLSLPCPMEGFASKDLAFDNCNTAARKALKDFAGKVEQNLQQQPLR